ncbi:MAG: lysophospholipase, partial [Propionibacteriaceae bacterium]|nr:lysophospholipase [Propionibacteriaceae bacterium]
MDPIRFDPPDRPRGVIQWVYGFGEHAGMYTPLAHYFNRHGYAFVINDLPGHGAMADLSPAQRRKRLGVVASYDDFLDDIWTIRSLIGQWHPNLPVILAGL